MIDKVVSRRDEYIQEYDGFFSKNFYDRKQQIK